MTDKPPPKKEKFEDHLKQVEEAVRNLEAGSLGLEESIAQYEAGRTALNRCFEILEQAEKKIEQLVRQKDGALAARPLELASEEKGARRRKAEAGDAPS